MKNKLRFLTSSVEIYNSLDNSWVENEYMDFAFASEWMIVTMKKRSVYCASFVYDRIAVRVSYSFFVLIFAGKVEALSFEGD